MASAAAAKKWPRPFQCGACRADEPQVGLVDQGGRLERLPRLLLGQLLGRQLAQLVVDQRQELLGGVRVALLDGGQDAGDVGHAGQSTAADATSKRGTNSGPSSVSAHPNCFGPPPRGP